MGLKDEIENLIRAEQAKLQIRDDKHKDYEQQQRNRFACLRGILQEVCDSIGLQYLRPNLWDRSATLKIGHINFRTNEWELETQWQIQPNYGWNPSAKAGEPQLYEKPGFILKTIEYYEFPGCPDDERSSEETQIFSDEKSLSEYLIEAVTKKVAQYRHWEDAADKIKEKK